MKISLYSCISSLLLSSIILSVICVVRKRYRFTKVSDVTTFSMLYMLGFIRLFLPLDFGFTRGIPFEGRFSWLWDILFVRKYELYLVNFSIAQLLVIIVLVISLIRCMKLIIKCIRDKFILSGLELYDENQLKEVLVLIKKRGIKIPKCKVVKSSVVVMPFVTGIIDKKIVLPDRKYADEDLFYILFHEFTHICKKDIYKKIVLECFKYIFWWIPSSNYVSKDMEQTMEIKCDSSVIKKLSDKEKIAYMQALINCMKQSADIKQSILSALSFALHENGEEMLERFKLMTNQHQYKGRRINLLITVMGIILLIITYLFVPFPRFLPVQETIAQDGELITSDNTYLVYKDGKYILMSKEVSSIVIPKDHIDNFMSSGIKIKEDES